MSERASRREIRRTETTRRLRWRALELTRDRGFDGWTMDDLAVAAEVSRRTVFNYFEAKADVVLGHPPEIDPAGLEEFLAGGPTGHLFDDLLHFAVQAASDKVSDLELERLLRQVVHDEPRLIALVHERFTEVCEFAADLILRREGEDFGVRRAQLALRLLISLLDCVVATADPGSERTFADLVADAAADARDLFHH